MKQSELRALNTELRGLTIPELVERLKEEKNQLTKLRFTHAVTELENPKKLEASKRLIARYLTELNARKHGINVETK